ncbi:MAG TPA: pyridoxamine 5'-phosphate oxidase [Actinobacteria bacterium]|jgi:predicted pyridoxine 5'-phosphate oxidase superfamily flavin-nucleotide-binding protein|nr:pyridoxamine 5'-phosphate oxidase [Actinomycetota bacterium]HCP60987.1 pyridoxamine 5'-phosphate oxidase [Actinomycetota bacterium]
MGERTMFHQGSRKLQDRFDTRRLADRIESKLVTDVIGPHDKDLIERMDCFFLATADDEGRPNCSYKGGAPGFVRVPDERTLALPYDGNGMYLSIGNVLRNPQVGLLFVDFERGTRLRVNGDATIDERDPLMPVYPEAQFVVRITVTEVFPNCPRYIHRRRLIQRSEFVPQADCPTLVTDWKRSEWARDALPENGPARDGT